MKSLHLVITLALLAALVSMTAFSAGIDGKNALSGQGRALVDRSKLDADLPVGGLRTAGNPIKYDRTMARPEVEAMNATALLKYPRVSAAGLSGTYTIPGDFPDLAAAAAVYSFVGLDGDATFELASGGFAGTAVFGAAPGADTYTLTIQPAAAASVTLSFVASATNGKGLVFNGAQNIVVQGVNGGSDLTLEMDNTLGFPTSDGFGTTVLITNASDGISILNTHIKGNFDTPAWADQTEGRSCAFIWTGEDDLAPNSNITFDGCVFEGGTVGIKSLSDWNSPVWVSYENLTVNANSFGGAFGDPLIHAMWLEVGYNPVLTNNVIEDLSFLVEYWDNYSTEFMEDNVFGLGGEGAQNTYYYLGQVTAFHLLLAHGGLIDGNYIDGVTSDSYVGSGQGTAYGTRTYSYDLGYGGTVATQISNNRFTNIFFDNSHMNLAVLRGPGFNAWHNSIRMTGTFTMGTPTTTGLNACLTAYNNAISNEITGSAASSTRGVNVGGDIDYNAIYSTGYAVAGYSTVNAAVAAGVNTHGLFGPVGFDADLHITAGATTAKEIGKSHVLPLADIDAESRDTTDAGKRDAGADEFSPAGSFAAADAFPGALLTPPAGVPVGVGQVPSATIKNNSQTPASFSVSLTATDGYSDSKPISLAAGEGKTLLFATWTPVAPGAVTFTVTTLLGGDAVPGNDVSVKVVTASAPVAPPAIYTFDASAEGWTGAVDWVRSSSFSKLGGPAGGSGFSWVTESPYDASTYTEGAYASSQGYGAGNTYPGANLLTSPWLDISGISATDLYISFQHSINIEPLWDRAWLEYTVDGLNWIKLGDLNDPEGINWYNESLYEHAAFDLGNFDTSTCEDLYGISRPLGGSWTSNDAGTTGAPVDFVPNGPTGYVYVQLHLTSGSHPAVVGASAIRFRYIGFSDAATAYPGGWAFDNFALGAAPPTLLGGTIDGHAWNDANGNGVDDGEADYTGTKVYISLFGELKDSVVTNGSGDYTWGGVTLPAGYGVKLDVTGTAFTVPFGNSNEVIVNHPSTGGSVVQDFGSFTGSVSGKVFSDVNDNGTNDGEPGLSGWTVRVYKDSVNSGILMGSKVSDGSGNYTMLLPAYVGSYEAVETAQPTVGRQTAPVGDSHVFSITGGSPTATSKDFGNFIFAKIRVQLTVDQNGNGVRDGGDIIAVPSGASADFRFIDESGPDTTLFSLGNGTIAASYTELDLGTYKIENIGGIPGWKRTKDGSKTVVVTTSGVVDTAAYLDFKYIVVTGKKYNDLNGNGALDGGEPGLAGWTINVSGGVYDGGTSAVTDVNGDYSIDSVFTGSHVVSEAAQAGYTQTAPVGGTYAINGISGNFVTSSGKDFGNYANANVDGIVYRDYNGNGVMDPEDTPISGVTVDLAVNGGSDVSDGSGYSFTGLIATDTVRITVPGGFVLTQPVAGEYALALTSGGSATGQNFGLFQSNDSTVKYRTFTAAQYGADDQKKPSKAPKAGKAYDPVKNKPSTANLIDDLIGKTGVAIGSIRVGIGGQLNAGGKTKAYVQPNKQGAFWGSLNKKSLHHTGMARGFDQDLKGKPILKLQKAFAPGKKQDNKLFAELLALKANLVASGYKTPAGLGILIYSDAGSPYDGWTIDEIAAYADTVMTNFEFQPLGIYTALDTIAAKINGAFYNPATDDTANGWASLPLTWKAYKSVYEVPFLKPNPGAQPRNWVAEVTSEPVPTEFSLSQNYPNPFNPTTTIEFDIPDESIVTLKIYNLLGQEVATLLDREVVDLGESLEFNASSLPSGVYLYRIVAETIADADAGIEAASFTQVKKMVLVK
jgi:hypothetical protein